MKLVPCRKREEVVSMKNKDKKTLEETMEQKKSNGYSIIQREILKGRKSED